MTLRISQFTAVCGLALLAVPGMVVAQVPRYQSPLNVPAAPQLQLPALPTPPAITPNGAVVEDIVVRVNDQIISRSDIERSEDQLSQELQQTGTTPADAAERQKNLLRDLIDKQLLLSRGKELGLSPDAEVTRRLNEIRKQYKLDTLEDLEKAARAQGVSFEDFKEGIREGVITQQVIQDEVSRNLHQPTQTQEQAFYEAHKQEFAQPEQVRLSEILVATPDNPTDAQVAEAKTKADGIEAKLKAGTSFDDLAKQNSSGQTASQGGDLGLFKRGALAKVLEDQTFDLKAGEVTAPIRTRQGFVLLKVTDHISPGVPTLKEVEPQIQNAMYGEQMQPALRAYLTKLREQSFIDIKPGFVDSGASAKQTKPVFSAYAAPVAKKKKKVQEKKRFDRGGRFSAARVGKDATPAETTPAPAPAVAAKRPAPAATTTAAKPVKANTSSHKQKKPKREKVRFGQAPRNSLPPGPEETATGTDVGAGAASAAVTPGGTMAQGAAPGAAIAPSESTTQYSPTSDPDPLAPKAAPERKTRYSDRAKTIHLEKAEKKQEKVDQKVAATPVAATSEEKTAAAQQAGPLGLNGDTAKKKKKKKVKGAPKERLQGKEQPAKEKTGPTDTTAPLVPSATPPPAPTPAPSSN